LPEQKGIEEDIQMQKWEYCIVYGIDLFDKKLREKQGGDEKKILVNFSDCPQIVYISEIKLQRVSFIPVNWRDKKTNLVDKINEVVGLIKKIFPDFMIDKKLAIADFFPDIKDISFELEKRDWNIRYEKALATLTIRYLLSTGWELMDRDGMWFKRVFKQ
jgi:hypothetical protein